MYKVSGELYNATDKEPLAFANIYVSDSKGKITPAGIGTTTDFDGTYSLSGVDPAGYIAIRHVSIPMDVVNVSKLKFSNGKATYSKDYTADPNKIPTVTVTASKAGKAVADAIETVKTTTKKNKWILPVTASVVVATLSLLAIRRWG